MKKLMIAVFIAAGMMACSENTSKEQSTTEENKTGTTDAEKREKEIADSTKMLDKKLADPNDPSTPDSLK